MIYDIILTIGGQIVKAMVKIRYNSPKKLAAALICRGWESKKILEQRYDRSMVEAMPLNWGADPGEGPSEKPEAAAALDMTGESCRKEGIRSNERAPLTRKERQRTQDQNWRKTAREQGLCQQRCGRRAEDDSSRCRE